MDREKNDNRCQCKHCGCELSKRIKIDNKIQNVCRTCGTVHYFRCDRCSELFSKHRIHFCGRNLCDLCVEAEFVQCDKCGLYVAPGEVSVHKEQMICRSCIDVPQTGMPPRRMTEKCPEVDVIWEEDGDVYDGLKRKVDAGAAALWLATELSGGGDVACDRKKESIDWGRIDEEEYDDDSDLC